MKPLLISKCHIMVWVFAALWLVGCQSTQNSWHMENTVVKNTRVERFPAMFTAPYTKTFHQECPLSARVDATMYEGFDKLKLAECVTMKVEINGVQHDHWDQAFEPGTLNGMGGSIIQAGAILGGAAILANGYKQSGSRLNVGQTNYNSNSTDIDIRSGGRYGH